jgi:hypothetical protein
VAGAAAAWAGTAGTACRAPMPDNLYGNAENPTAAAWRARPPSPRLVLQRRAGRIGPGRGHQPGDNNAATAACRNHALQHETPLLRLAE